MTKNKWLLALSAAGAFALVSACGDKKADCTKAKTPDCGKGKYAHCMVSGNKCIAKPTGTSAGNDNTDTSDNTNATDTTGQQNATGKVCRNKVGIKWDDLAKLTKTTDADKKKECNDKKFGPGDVKPFKWEEGGKCELTNGFCYLGASQKFAANNATVHADQKDALGRLLNANQDKFGVYKSDGTTEVTSACGADGTLAADLVADNPCMKETDMGKCLTTGIKIHIAQDDLILGGTDDAHNVTITSAAGYCRWNGPKNGCMLQPSEVGKDFGCAGVTDEKKCKDDYKDVCELVELKNLKTISSAKTTTTTSS